MNSNDSENNSELFNDLGAFLRGEYTKPATPEPRLPAPERIYKKAPASRGEVEQANNSGMAGLMEIFRMVQAATKGSPEIKWTDLLVPGLSVADFSPEFIRINNQLDTHMPIAADVIGALQSRDNDNDYNAKVAVFVLLRRVRIAQSLFRITLKDTTLFFTEMTAIVNQRWPGTL